MGDHGDRSVALHHIRTEPESHTRRTASLCGSLSWFIYNFIGGLVGEKGKRYIPFLGTILIYLGCANISGFFRAKPPTKDLNVTAGLAIISCFWSYIPESTRKDWRDIYTVMWNLCQWWRPLTSLNYLQDRYHCVCDFLEMS